MSTHASEEEHAVERKIGYLLISGVLLAAAVILMGGILYLIPHGMEPIDYRVFRGEPTHLCAPWQILEGAIALDSQSVIQLGLLLLIATPVARVVFTVVSFVRQRDLLYVVITLIVLGVLLVSLFTAQGHSM